MGSHHQTAFLRETEMQPRAVSVGTRAAYLHQLRLLMFATGGIASPMFLPIHRKELVLIHQTVCILSWCLEKIRKGESLGKKAFSIIPMPITILKSRKKLTAVGSQPLTFRKSPLLDLTLAFPHFYLR